MFAGRVQLEEEFEGQPRPCAIKRLSVDKGLRAERLLQEALTMIKCQDPSRPLLLAVALGDDHYCLVSAAAGEADGGSEQSGPHCTDPTDRAACSPQSASLINLSLLVTLAPSDCPQVLERMDLTLAEYLKERSPSPAAVIRLLLRCAELLQRVHNQGVCHYDIKAANFLMSEDGSRMVRAAAAGGRLVSAAAGCWDGSCSSAV